ncbi:MAG TPA: FeoA family protein [Treponemataceae bacterium]|nr:FeoA family protein [Treponemataceae bacterium]
MRYRKKRDALCHKPHKRKKCACKKTRSIPLHFQDTGKNCVIEKFCGGCVMRQHLNDLGLIPGDTITVLSKTSSGIIIRCKGAKMAMNRGLAQHILTTA